MTIPVVSVRRTALALALLALAGVEGPLAAADRDHPDDARLPPSSREPWIPPAAAKPAAVSLPAAQLSPEIAANGLKVNLLQVLDIALRNNDLTRATWLDAQAAAAQEQAKRAAYWPHIGLSATLERQRSTAPGGQTNFLQTTYGPGADLNWLLLDFGGRRAEVDEARQALYAADWTHNAQIHDLVLRTAKAYYGYLGATALRESLLESLKQAETNLDAARERHRAGLATVADELQAKTLVSQERLALAEVSGQTDSIRGALLIAIGLPPDLRVEVEKLPEQVPLQAAAEAADSLLSRSINERPDLLAARAKALADERHVGKVVSDGLPSLVAFGNLGRTYYIHPLGPSFSNTYAIGVGISFPLFTGFENRAEISKARAEAAASGARAADLQTQVLVQVWQAYYGLQTAGQRVETSRDLLASASQSAEVAQGRYKEGVGSILDLLTAQSALADARAQEVSARADWFVALAQLAHDSGLSGPLGAPAAPASSSNEGNP